MTKPAAIVISTARQSVNSAPRARNAARSGIVAATMMTFASLAILLRQIAQTAATTQTATSASANSTTPSRHVEIAIVSANANVSTGPSTVAARTLRRTRSSASSSMLARALNQETSRKPDTATSAAGRTTPLKGEPVDAVAQKSAKAARITTPWT
jgi:hypothetical protein